MRTHHPQADTLEHRHDYGGRRHYLLDRPVYAGTILLLETDDGWVLGRYEWSFDWRPPQFYYAVPGADELASMAIDSHMRLAWPDPRERD